MIVRSVFAVVALAACVFAVPQVRPVPDVPFLQETRDEFRHPGDARANDVRGLTLDRGGTVWLATGAGIFRLDGTAWVQAVQGPAFAAFTASDGTVWLGAWNGLYRVGAENRVAREEGITAPIAAIGEAGGSILATGPDGVWRTGPDGWVMAESQWANSPRGIVPSPENETYWVPTGHGLFQARALEVIGQRYDVEELLSGNTAAAAFDPDGLLWIGSNAGLDVYDGPERVGWYTAEEGLPFPEIRRIAFNPEDGILWAATNGGVVRFDGANWSLRHSRRWLPSDDARDIAFGADGTAWIATGNGVSAIRRQWMTLAEKAEHYHRILLARKVRAPHIVESSRLLTPGDVTTSVTEDDDNDGSYTQMYMVMEIFRHLVTGDPASRARALKAWESAEFLLDIAEPDGFIARTVAPIAWTFDTNPNPYRFHDRNRTYTPEERAERRVRDPRYKPVEERWILSDDGEWLWKRDTSSDEIVGHFWGAFHFHEFLAETEAEKARARRFVTRIMDHILDGGLNLIDTDGTHTRWGVWAPDRLLEDLDWRAERSVNATEILSFLKAAHHMTGEARFEDAYRKLMDDYGYLNFARAAKPTNPSEFTHIDAELLVMVWPALLMGESDPMVRAVYEMGLDQWYAMIAHEHSPFFAFTYAGYGGQPAALEESVAFLRDAPLDLIHWTVDNRHRDDLNLVRWPQLDRLQTDRLPPASERGVMRWDKNPWQAVQGDGGQTESAGVYWLLPYWMGRYFGLIAAPADE